MKICHITSVHQRYDTRIFLKMCCSLAKNGNEVTLLVADGLGNEIKTGIQILDIGSRSPSRVSRMINTVRKIYKRAVELDIDIYHLHDPELIPLGLKLKKSGKKVIFDAHAVALFSFAVLQEQYQPDCLFRFCLRSQTVVI